MSKRDTSRRRKPREDKRQAKHLQVGKYASARVVSERVAEMKYELENHIKPLKQRLREDLEITKPLRQKDKEERRANATQGK